MTSDELSRMRRAFTTVLPSAAPRQDCPPAERLWDGVRDDLTPAELREVIDHVAICPVCTEAWRLAQALEGNPVGKARGHDTRGHDTRLLSRGWVAGAAAAVAALLVAALGIGFFDRDASRPPVATRGPEAPSSELAIDAPLSRTEGVLRWRGPAGAQYYNLSLFLAEDTLRGPLVEASKLAAPEFRLPAEILESLPAGTELLVRLEAVSSIGGETVTDVLTVEVE